MKIIPFSKILLPCIFSIQQFTVFCQIQPDAVAKKEKYTHRAKVFRHIGFTALSAGVLLFVIAGEKSKQLRNQNSDNFLNLEGLGEDLMGIACLITSLTSFIIASTDKAKARSIPITTQKLAVFNFNMAVPLVQPLLAFKINF
jgi:hypothetical protein